MHIRIPWPSRPVFRNVAAIRPGRIPVLLGALMISPAAMAYVGPGAGVTMLGALWGVIVAILFVIGGLLYWPIKVLFRKRDGKATTSSPPDPAEADPNPQAGNGSDPARAGRGEAAN